MKIDKYPEVIWEHCHNGVDVRLVATKGGPVLERYLGKDSMGEGAWVPARHGIAIFDSDAVHHLWCTAYHDLMQASQG